MVIFREKHLFATTESPIERIFTVMRRHGASRIIFKLLANNDNSKQQIYLGGDEIIHLLPHGDLVGSMSQSDGPMYKAKVHLKWISLTEEQPPSPAPGTQLIYYPRYPEVRLSGFLRGSPCAPNYLMRPPTKAERAYRDQQGLYRCLTLGICSDGEVLAYCGSWGDDAALDASSRIADGTASNVASVFYEIGQPLESGRTLLLKRLHEIYIHGPVRSGRLNADGALIEYQAMNGAGYTLESLFGITPNGNAEPDYEGWELKVHKSGAMTLMTPEPDMGTYRSDLGEFLIKYGRCKEFRRDFTGRHIVNAFNNSSGLMMTMEGYNFETREVSDPTGGLMLRDRHGLLAAGWSFDKIVTHWSRKHAQTAFVSYDKIGEGDVFYSYGPMVYLCSGPALKSFLNALYTNAVYHDPGIKMEFSSGRWRSKKRNQFRTTWRHVDKLYETLEAIDLSSIQLGQN